jgi:hypothetical protein
MLPMKAALNAQILVNSGFVGPALEACLATEPRLFRQYLE